MAGNIHEYQTPELGLTPTDKGIDAFAQGARRIGAFYNQTGEDYTRIGQQAGSAVASAGQVAVDYMDHQQINDGAAKGTQLMSNLNQKWQDTLKQINLNDPDAQQKLPAIKQKFLEESVEPALDNFQKGFSTDKSQQFAEQFVERQRNHMFEKTAGDVSALAGEAVKVNAAKTVNNLASVVATDPSTHSIDNALWTVDHTLGSMVDSSPNLDAVKAAGLKGEVAQVAKEQIVKAAVISMITKNPNVDLEAIQQKYGDYLKPGEMKTFQNAARTQAKVDAYHDKSAAIAQRQLDDLNVHKSATDTISKNVSVDPQSGQPIINPKFFNDALEIARKNPDAPSAAATVRTMLDWGESQQNKEHKPADDPAIVKGLSDKLFDPEKPTTTLDLMKAHAAGKISDHTFATMNGLVKELAETPLKGPVYQDTMKAAHDQLVVNVPGIPGKDTIGTTKYAQFVQSFVPQYIAKSRAGTLEPNALDVSDPNSMISKAMAPYKRTQSQRMQDFVAGAGGLGSAPATPPRNDVMPAIPAPDQRNAGSVYETPRGKMKWTGTGWVAP